MLCRLISAAAISAIGVMLLPTPTGLAQGGGPPAWVPGRPGDWLLHNLDLHNRRFSPLDQINRTNVDKLTVKWTFDIPKTLSLRSTTPIVLNGVMYFNAGTKFFAVDADNGRSIWTVEGSRTASRCATAFTG